MNTRRHVTRIASALLVGSFISAGAQAGGNGNAVGNSPIEQRLAALEALVVDLQAQIDANAALLQYVTVVDGEIDGLAGPHFIIEGANVHVRSGAGSTAEGCNGIDYDCLTRTGLGNLVIGYNEQREAYFPYDCENDPDAIDAEGVSRCTKRNGAHHLVVGIGHNITGHGGMVAGIFGEAKGSHTTVTGGYANTAQAPYASVSGGSNNHARGTTSSVSGGSRNSAEGRHASVTAGDLNVASGDLSSVGGGAVGRAEGLLATVGGGLYGLAAGTLASVNGGDDNKAFGFAASVSGGINNTAWGDQSSITGGVVNQATGWNTAILGGDSKTAAAPGCVVGDDGVDC